MGAIYGHKGQQSRAMAAALIAVVKDRVVSKELLTQVIPLVPDYRTQDRTFALYFGAVWSCVRELEVNRWRILMRSVWARRCTNCGSRERLEYDHIIPVSRGGSNTERNIELLCEACNRTKSSEIG